MNSSFDIQVNTDQITDIKNRIGEFISKMYTVYEEISKNKDELVTNEYWTGKTYDEFVGKFDEWKPKFIAFLNEMSLVDLYLDAVIQLSQSIIDKRDSIFSEHPIDKSISPSNKTILQYHKNSGNDLLTKITDWEGDVGQIQCRINNLDNRINDISSDGRIVAASNINSIISDSKENKRIMDNVWHTFMDTCRLNMGSFINYIAGYEAMFNGMIDNIRNENLKNTSNGSTQLIKSIIEDNEYNNNLKQIANELGVSRRDAEILLMAMSDEGQQLLDNDPAFEQAIMQIMLENKLIEKEGIFKEINKSNFDTLWDQGWNKLGDVINDKLAGIAEGIQSTHPKLGKMVGKVGTGIAKVVNSLDIVKDIYSLYAETERAMDDTWDVANYSDPDSVANAHEQSSKILQKAAWKGVVIGVGVIIGVSTGGLGFVTSLGIGTVTAIGSYGLNEFIDESYGDFNVNNIVTQ